MGTKVTKVNSRKKPLSFEEFKAQHLKTFKEYKELHREYYDDKDIERGYELYTRGRYKGYLIEEEQVNPGIIL